MSFLHYSLVPRSKAPNF